MNFYDKRDFLVTFSFFVFHFDRGKYFQWTTDHDVIMCREVLVCEPYKFKPRTPERGQSWESVAQQLNSIHQPSFRVIARFVRDRFTLLSTKYAEKLRMEASGIEGEHTELDSLLEEILEREKEAKKSKVEKEKATAEEVRRRALERMAKPKVEDQENKQKTPKVRRSTAEAIDYLREREIGQRRRVRETRTRGQEERNGGAVREARSSSQTTAGYVYCTDGTDADATTEPAKYASYASCATGATNQASEGIL